MEKSDKENSARAGLTVLGDLIRFIVTWGLVTVLWINLHKCPYCGTNHLHDGDWTPIAAGFLFTLILHGIRVWTRRSKLIKKSNSQNETSSDKS